MKRPGSTTRDQVRQERRENTAPYGNLFDRVPIGIYSITREGKILDANPAFVAMHGFAALADLRKVNLSDYWVDKVALARMRAMRESNRVVQNFEAQFLRPDGTTFW